MICSQPGARATDVSSVARAPSWENPTPETRDDEPSLRRRVRLPQFLERRGAEPRAEVVVRVELGRPPPGRGQLGEQPGDGFHVVRRGDGPEEQRVGREVLAVRQPIHRRPGLGRAAEPDQRPHPLLGHRPPPVTVGPGVQTAEEINNRCSRLPLPQARHEFDAED